MDAILNNIGILLTAVGGTGFFTFLFTKGKYKVDVLQAKENAETTAIENDVKLSAHYKEILDDLKQRYESRYKEFEELMNGKVLLHKEELKHFQEVMNRKVSMLEEELKLKDRKIKLQQIEITELKRDNRLLRAHAKENLS